MERIYLDHAAASRMDPRVLEYMLPWLESGWGNPSSLHREGREARAAVEEARRRVAGLLGALPEKIFFTSGGTESDNWALKGTAWALRNRGRHIVAGSIEHPAVLEACRWLEGRGFEVSYLPVGQDGRVSAEDVRRTAKPGTVLISVMAANNETGVLQPVEEIGRLAKSLGIPFHCDGVQAAGAVPLRADETGADLISLSAHKIHGPKGTGALYVRRGTALEALLHGGAQEGERRAGTLNVAGIAGMGEAFRLAQEGLGREAPAVAALRTRFEQGLTALVPGVSLNGHPKHRLPGIANLCFHGIRAEALLARLDLEGVSVSAGPACSAGSPRPSHVLLAMGLSEEDARSSLRFSFSRFNREEEVDRLLELLPRLLHKMRESPFL